MLILHIICTSVCVGKVTSLVAKKDDVLATRIEEAIRKNESLESLTADNVRRDIARDRITAQKEKNAKSVKVSSERSRAKSPSSAASATTKSTVHSKGASGKASSPAKTQKSAVRVSKSVKLSRNNPRKPSSESKKQMASRRRPGVAIKSTGQKLNVVGFRGRSNQSDKRQSVSS